jgi:hypothetical protein
MITYGFSPFCQVAYDKRRAATISDVSRDRPGVSHPATALRIFRRRASSQRRMLSNSRPSAPSFAD